jgi:hypothetical protein
MDAKEKGTTYVLLSPLNKTYSQLSPEFIGKLVDFGMEKLDDKWARYYNTPQLSYFDYTIFIAINSIYISPDDAKETKEIVKKDVRDGWKYQYDSKGNVKKDSLGNDIKVPKFKTISCTITRKEQAKYCVIKASLDIQDNTAKRIVSTSTEEARYNFQYRSAYANGDFNALSDEDKKLTQNSPVAFPDDMTMIKYCMDELKPKIESNIRNNRKQIN